MAGDPPILHVFMDESGQSTDRYMCVGGIVVNRERLDEVRAGIVAIKEAGGVHSEVKWTNLRSHRLRTYKLLVEYFFTLLRARQVHFHALICDFSRFDHRNNGGREAGVSRMLFQLALHKVAFRYGTKADIHLFPDSGDCGDMFCQFRYHLNNASRKEMPDGRRSAEFPVRHIEPLESHTEPLLQLNDLILGAISYRRNERYNAPDASKHKKALARLVALRADATTFHYNPQTFGRRFTVWNFRSPDLRKVSSRS